MSKRKPTFRVYATVTPETMAKLDMWSEKTGMAKSNLVNMSLLIGLDQLIKTLAPETWLTPEVLAAMGKSGAEEIDKQGK